ncbi:MAG: YbhB/YbcL family Raf kinase inhibitor-like protein [Promethearchaeota archaeon]
MRRFSIILILVTVASLLIVGFVIFWVFNLEGKDTSFRITSPAFSNGTYIPDEFTCHGSDINPELNILNTPNGTITLALIMDDPDAQDIPWVSRIWIHWVVWNIPSSTEVIPEGDLPEGAIQGLNSWSSNDYGGPCPPAWRDHRYFFKVYALDIELNLPANSTGKGSLLAAMEGHIIDQAVLMGRFAGDEVNT